MKKQYFMPVSKIKRTGGKQCLRIFSFFFALILLLPLPAAALSEDGLGGGATQIPAEAALNLACRSALLTEQTTGRVLYEMNADEALPIASVTKVMTLLLVMEALAAGTIRYEDMVSVSENAASMGGSQVYLEPGEQISVHELLKAVFVSSANDGATALAEFVSGSVESFVSAMNQRAAELGATNTTFYNPTGLDDEETNLSSARDIALMSNELLRHDDIYSYSTIWIDSIRNGAFGLSNTNKLVRFYPGATGLKTGSTAKAKYCVSASAARNNLRLCAVVLAGETSADRFNAAKVMLDYGFANYAYFVPEAYNAAKIPVWGGSDSAVSTYADNAGILMAKAAAAGITSRIELAAELTAPVERDQVVGKIIYEKSGAIITEIPILAANAVPKLSFGGILTRLLRQFFFARAA